MPYDWRDYVANDPSDFKPKGKKKKKGGPSRPPSSRRASTWEPTDDALVWAQEQQIQSFQLPKVPKKKKVPKTFAESMGERPLSWQQREALRRKRVQWARDAFDPRKRDTAQQKLAATMSPDRQLDILKRDLGQPGERVEAESFNKMVARTRIKERIRQTKDEDERKRLNAALDFMEDEGFNPLAWTGHAVMQGARDVAGTYERGLSLLGRAILSPKEKRELTEYLTQVQQDTGAYSEWLATKALPRKLEEAEQQQAGIGGIPGRARRIAAASIRSGVQAAVGLGPGLVYMAGSPRQALDEYERYIKDYYGPLLHGDIRPLEEQGLTPGIMDILGLAAGGYGAAGRVRALGRTARYPGELRLSSAGRRITRPEALARAAIFRQEPVDIVGSGVTTMGRPVGHRALVAEEPVPQGERVQTGDRVEYRVGDETKETIATEKNGLVGMEAPDVNNPLVRQVHGEDAEVTSVFRQGDFEQRMLPRSPVGQAISDLYWWARPSTGRGRGLLTGKGARKKAVREAREVTEDRFRGQVKAFMKDHKDIQKDVVLSTAYDRMIRYGDDAPTEVTQEIAARRQRGLDKTKEQRQVLAALEQAEDQVANPSMKLQVAVAAGRMISADTEEFLIRRGFLTQERADTAKLAAKRWVREGHLEDAPLSSPRRTQIREELLDHFHGDEKMTDLAMAYTDTLARAESARTGMPPEQWYERNIRDVKAVSPEQMEAMRGQEPSLLAQEREVKRTPVVGETFPYRDPATGEMRVAKLVNLDLVPVMPEVGQKFLMQRPADTLRRHREATLHQYHPETGKVRVRWEPRAKAVTADLKVGDVFVMPEEGHGMTWTVTEPNWAVAFDAQRNVQSTRSLRGNERVQMIEHARGTEDQEGFLEEVPWSAVENAAPKRHADTATITWTRGPEAGVLFDVPLDTIQGNAEALRGWYSGISIKVEQMPEVVGRQQVEALKKAPGVKADEWKWLGMDDVIEGLFNPPGEKPRKSVSRDDLKKEIRRKSLVFTTETLDHEYTYYFENYGVTLGGPLGDYTETLIYYPSRYEREVLSLEDNYVEQQARDRWIEEHRDEAYDAWEEGQREYAHERWYEDLEEQRNNEDISEEEYQEMYIDGPEESDLQGYMGEPDEYDLEQYMGEPDYSDLEGIVEEMQAELDRQMGHDSDALYMAPHFGADYGEQPGHEGNLLAHQRASLRWAEGSLVDYAEEYQSDWHQEAGATVGYDDEGQPIRRGYKRKRDPAAIGVARGEYEVAREAEREALQAAYDAMEPGTRVRSRYGTSNIKGSVKTNAASHHVFEVEWDPEVREYMEGPSVQDWMDFKAGDDVWTDRGKKGTVVEKDGEKWFHYDDDEYPDYQPHSRARMYRNHPQGDYAPGPGWATEQAARSANIADARKTARDFQDTLPMEDEPAFKLYQEYEAAKEKHQQARQHLFDLEDEGSGPPEAPYSGHAWEELLFREGIRQAVSKGRTRYAWTTGKVQAERYNKLLAENINRLEWDGEHLTATNHQGESNRWHWHQFRKSERDPIPVALSRALGSGLAKKLLESQPEEQNNTMFRIDRVVERDENGNPTQYESLNRQVEDFQPGDIVYVKTPPDDPAYGGYDTLQFQVTGEGRLIDRWNTQSARATAERGEWDFPVPFEEDGLGRDQFRDFAGEVQAQARPPRVVLEGEDIQVGGGGFIGAYDVRLPRYATKYLGKEANPRRVPLDDLTVEEVPGQADFDIDPESGTITELTPPSLFILRAGDTVLAEGEAMANVISVGIKGGPDAGLWTSRVRYNVNAEPGKRWEVIERSGTPGAATPHTEKVYSGHATAKEAVDSLNNRSYDWRQNLRMFSGKGDDGLYRAKAEGDAWVVDIPEKFAAEMHEKGSPLFQRRQGSVFGLARLTEDGADIYLNRDAADIPTYVEEATHAVLPSWFDDADAQGDLRGDYVRDKFGVEPGGQITNAANEEMTRFLQVMLSEGFVPAPQMRSLMRSISTEMRKGYEGGAAKIVRNAEERKKFDRLLRDPEVTSFFREQFDVAPVKELDPGPIYFQTMKTQGRLTRPGVRKLPGAVRSILPSRGRRLTKHPNTMKAWEEGTFDVGPDMTAHYANAELRSRMQDEQAQRVLRYQEPIEIVDGVPTLKDGYQVYNYFGIRRANARLDEMFRRSQRYGDIDTSEEPMLSGDAASGSILDMDPEDFTDYVGETVGAILQEDMLFGSVEEAVSRIGESDFLRLVREGKVGQIPTDIAQTFLNASGGGYSFAAASSVLHGIMAVLRLPSMLARWRMIGKFAYPIVNTGATGFLALVNQGPAMPWNFYRQYAHHSRSTRIQLLQEVGVGIAELTDVPGINAANWLERLEAKEQEVFRSAMHTLSVPESHIRLTQMENDLARAGYRTDSDISRLLSMVHRGDPAATRLMNQIGRNAEDGVVRFRGMRPEEQFLVRDLLFVYGWLRAAARFTVRWPLDRPVTAAAAFHIGQYGWEKLQEDFYALAWEQQGAYPISKRQEGEETMRRIIDMSQLFPFKSGIDLMRPFFQLLGLQDTGMRPATFADLLSPSADFAMRAVYGQDPRFATGFWDGIKYDLDVRNMPGVFWASRLIDPSLTGTKLRADRSRWDVVMNLFFGQAAPYEIKQSVSYERWLEQQPADIRTLIREQNDANEFALYAEAAANVDGGSMSSEQLRAINADAAYSIYTGLLQSKKRRDKKDSSYYLSSLERSASRGTVLQQYYPDAYEQALAETSGLDPLGNETDAETYSQIMDEAWEENVSDTMSETRTLIKDNLGFEAPESSKVPFKRWARDVRWLQTAPPQSIERIQEQMAKRGIQPGNQLALAPIIEDEMLRLVKP